MSAFGGKADMAFCRNSLSRSLLRVKRTSAVALQMSANDPKRTRRNCKGPKTPPPLFWAGQRILHRDVLDTKNRYSHTVYHTGLPWRVRLQNSRLQRVGVIYGRQMLIGGLSHGSHYARHRRPRLHHVNCLGRRPSCEDPTSGPNGAAL